MASEWLPDVYIRAYRFAAKAHWSRNKKQLVPGTDIPYLMHFSMVAMEVIAALENEAGLNGNLAVQCALLHDTIEDTHATYDDLAESFGRGVADGVQSLSKDETLGRGLPEQQRKSRQMTDSLERIKQQPKEIWIVKMADRVTNLQPPPAYWTPEKINRYREEALQIHLKLKAASCYLADRLEEKIKHYP